MSIELIDGDITLSNERVIAHQCNCVTRNSAGLARVLFSKFPYSNVYQQVRTPGEVIISHKENYPIILNMIAQYYPGKANLTTDTKVYRLAWFRECLDSIGSWMKLHNHSRISFPFKVGCGLAGGNWTDYYQAIVDFQIKYQIDVKLYRYNPS